VVLADVAGNSVVAALPPALADDRTTSLTNDQDQTTLVAVGIIICPDAELIRGQELTVYVYIELSWWCSGSVSAS